MSYVRDLLAAELPGPLKENFGDSVTYTPIGGSAVVITAIIRDPAPAESGFPGNVALGKVLRSDLAAEPAQGDVLVFGSDMYTVFDVKSNTIGFRILGLHKTA